MTDSNQDCPQGLSLTDYSIRSCGRAHSGENGSSSVSFPDPAQFIYNRVCGRVTAYRWSHTGAFSEYYRSNVTIDGPYVDGLSLTHGSPRTHIWTFASGQFNGNTGLGTIRCPCEEGYSDLDPPPFVGDDYFCETVAGDESRFNPGLFYPNNALWDGQDYRNPCYGLNNPPWFFKTLPWPTYDNIDLRLCLRYNEFNANIAIELLEIYVR